MSASPAAVRRAPEPCESRLTNATKRAMELARRDLDEALVHRLVLAHQRSSRLLVAEGREALLDNRERSIFKPERVELGDPDHAAAWSALPATAADTPRPIALYQFEEITIASGGTLRIAGPPMILVVERLTIEPGSTLYVHSLMRMFVGTLQRIPVASGESWLS